MKLARALSFLTCVLWLACGSHDAEQAPVPAGGPPVSRPEPNPTAVADPPASPEPPPPPLPEAQQPFVLPQVQTSVPQWSLDMPQEALNSFYENSDAPEVDATFTAEGKSYPVKVRLRGASARTFPKKSWNVSFEKGTPFQGRGSLNLVAEYADATLMAEKMAYDMLAAMRVPAPKATYVRLKLNGHDEGPFLDIEQVSKPFLRAHGMLDTDATIYRAGWKDTEFKTWRVPYQGEWQKKTNESESDQPLRDVLEVINHTPEPQLASVLPQHFELEGYLRSMTLDALMSNNYVEDSESYFIHDRVTGRWYYVPWDLNNVDARWWYQSSVDEVRPHADHPLFNFTLTDGWTQAMYDQRQTETEAYPGYLPVFSNLGTRVVTNPELRARLVARINKALDEFFKPEVMNPYIDQLYQLLDPYMKDAPYVNGAPYVNDPPDTNGALDRNGPPDMDGTSDTDYPPFSESRKYMKNWVALRRTFLQSELRRYAEQQPGLVLEQFAPAEGWVELRNRGGEPVSLSGMTLTTNLRISLRSSPGHPDTQVRAPIGAVLPDVTLQPGERVRFTAAQLGLTFDAKGEIGVFDGVSVVGVKDLLFYGALPSGQHYVRGENGWEAR